MPVPGGFQVAVELTRTPGTPIPLHPVPFTAEPYAVEVPPGTRSAEEGILFGSRLAMDLNGDGDTKDRFEMNCTLGDAVLGGTQVRALGRPLRIYRPDPTVRLGKQGQWLLLYRDCESAAPSTLGLSNKPIEVVEVPGPVLQLLVLQPIDQPTGEAAGVLEAFTVDGAPKTVVVQPPTRTYERLFGAQPEWAQVRWAMVPLSEPRPHRLTFRWKGAGRALAVAIVNAAPAPGQRIRGQAGAVELK